MSKTEKRRCVCGAVNDVPRCSHCNDLPEEWECMELVVLRSNQINDLQDKMDNTCVVLQGDASFQLLDKEQERRLITKGSRYLIYRRDAVKRTGTDLTEIANDDAVARKTHTKKLQVANDLLRLVSDWSRVYWRDGKVESMGDVEMRGTLEAIDKHLADQDGNAERLERFASMTISQALRSYHHHITKGVKPAWVPPIPRSTAISILRDAKHSGLITQKEIDGDVRNDKD